MREDKLNKAWKIRLIGLLLLLIGSGLWTLGIGLDDVSRPGEDLSPTLESILKELAGYEQGRNDDIVVKFNGWMRENRSKPELREKIETDLDLFLKSEATLAAKMEVCRQLRIFGSSRSVPVLESLLLDEDTSDMARYALEKIPGSEASRALLGTLDKTRGTINTGIINSLGNRGEEEAVPALALILDNDNPTQSAAAAASLARIGGAAAVESLRDALSATDENSRSYLSPSLLECALKTYGTHDPERLAEICLLLTEETNPDPVRRTAFRERLRLDPAEGRNLILRTLQGREGEFIAPALDCIPLCFDASSIGPVCETLSGLEPPHRLQLIDILSRYDSPQTRKAVAGALDDQDAAVRTAALSALGRIGDGSSIPLLARRAAAVSGPEQEAARESLTRLRGEEIDELFLEALAQNRDSREQSEFILAIGERRIHEAAPVLFEASAAEDRAVRLQAVRALRNLAGPESLTRLIEKLFASEDERERDEWILAVSSAAGRLDQASDQGTVIAGFLDESPDSADRASLFRVLGKIGDDATLPVLRAAAEDPDPVLRDSVIRALAEWPTDTPKDDLLDIAARTDNLTHHALALQGFVRMVGQDRFRLPKAAVASLENAISLARRPEEKKAVLGALPRFACVEALQLAESLLWDEDVREESSAAVVRIRQALENSWRR